MVYTVDSIESLSIEFYEIFYSFISVSKFESFHRTAVVSLAAAGSGYFLHLRKSENSDRFVTKFYILHRQNVYAMILATSTAGFWGRIIDLPIELINVMDNMSRLKLCICALEQPLQNICRHQRKPVFAIL